MSKNETNALTFATVNCFGGGRLGKGKIIMMIKMFDVKLQTKTCLGVQNE